MYDKQKYFTKFKTFILAANFNADAVNFYLCIKKEKEPKQ